LLNSTEHFLLTAGQLERCLYRRTSMNQFPRARSQVIQKIFAGRDHHPEVIRPLVAHQAVNNKQADGLIDGDASIRIRFHFEAMRAGPFIDEDESLRMN